MFYWDILNYFLVMLLLMSEILFSEALALFQDFFREAKFIVVQISFVMFVSFIF